MGRGGLGKPFRTTRGGSALGTFAFGRVLLAACALASVGYHRAWAQVLPGPAQPGHIEKRFEQPELPKSGGEIVTPEKEGAVAPPGAEAATFVLSGVVVEGATVFQPADFLSLYDKYLGSTVSVKTIYDIAQAITTKYTAAGYVLSQAVVPPQKINGDGIVRIRVIEGYVDKVIIKGEVKGRRDLLEQYGEKIRAARPLTLAVLERYLLLASDLPGVTAGSTLIPSETTPGAADLIFEIGHKDVDAFASLDNRGGAYLGPWQLSGGLNLNSLAELYERTSLQVAATPLHAGELKYGRIAHEETLDSEGTRLSLDAGYSDSHPGWTLKPNALRSHYLFYGMGLSQSVIRSRSENLTLGGRAEAKNSVTDQIDQQQIIRDRLRILRGGGSYDWVDSALATPAVSLVSVELSQGFDALGATSPGSSGLSRSVGHADFFKVTLDASRNQRLSPDVFLQLGASAQWAGVSLLSSEQFAFGGAQFGRGYDPAEITGDHGIAGKAELQYSGPEIPAVKSWQLYTFYDIGRVWNADPLASEYKTASAASAGLGIRSSLNDTVSVNAELAKPLTHPVAAHDGYAHSPRAFFGVTARY